MTVSTRILPVVLALTTLGCNRPPQLDAQASPALAEPASLLVGTWILDAIETTDPAGRVVDTSHPVGTLTYSAGGRMAVQIMVLPRPVVPPVPQGPDTVSAWSPDQVRQVVETYDAYFGTYEVDEARQIVTHLVEGELRPNLVGAAYARRYQLDGDRLVLGATASDEYWRVVWKRVKQAGASPRVRKER